MISPIKNMRITFWGTQGSCQFFPGPEDVSSYTYRIAHDLLQRVLEDLAKRTEGRTQSVADLFGGSISDAAVEEYLDKLGLLSPAVYGGETTCLEVETSEDNVLVFDGGSGIRQFAKNRVKNWAHKSKPVLYIFGSHDHLDHRIGLPFADFCFRKSNPFRLKIYGHHNFLAALDERFGIFSK